MIRRLCTRLSFVLLLAPFALLASMEGAAASSAGGCVGDQVVALDKRVNSQVSAGDPESFTRTLPTPLAAGVYDIQVVTADAYEGRASKNQDSEQVVVVLGDVTFGPTPDLADGEDSATATLSGQVELAASVDSLTVRHVLSATEKHQSVEVVCVSFTAVGDTPVPTPPPQPAPVPACAGDHVVEIGKRVDSRGSTPNSRRASFPGTVPAGRYDISVVTFDAYEGRASTNQPNEQVVVVLGDTTFGPTADLADGLESVAATATGRIELTQPIAELEVRHYLSGTNRHNSVGVGCISLTSVADPPPPPPEPTPPPGVELAVDHRCAPAPAVVVELSVDGAPQSVVVTVDGVPTPSEALPDVSNTIVIPVEPGVRTVTVEIAGALAFSDDVEVACPGEPGEGEPGSGEEPGGEEEPGSGEEPGGEEEPGSGEEPGGEEEPGSGEEPGGEEEPGSGEEPGGEDPISEDPIAPPTAPVVTPLGFIPELTLRVACADQTIEASVDNVGDTLGGVTLAIAPSARAVQAEVAPASTTTVALPLPAAAEGTRTEVVVVTDTGEIITGTAEVDCLTPAAPTAQVTIDCAAGTVAVVVENAGGESTTIQAFAERTAVLGSAELAGGEQVRYEVELAGPTVPLRIVTEDGTDVLREEIAHSCRQDDVAATLLLVCPSETVELELVNGSDEPRTVIVETDGVAESVELGGGERAALSRSLSTTTEVRVLSAFGDLLLEEPLDDWECDPLSADSTCSPGITGSPGWVVAADGAILECSGFQGRLIVDCSSDAGLVEIGNGTDRRAVVTVLADGTVVASPTLEIGDVATVPIDEVSGVRVTAEAAGERLLDTSADCRGDPDRTAAVLGGLLVALMTIVALVVARFDPWMRV